MTSSGCLAALVGKRFLCGGFCVCLSEFICTHFTHIQDHDYVLYWCGVYWALCGRLVLFFFIQKNGKRIKRNLVESGQL